ncbi:MAG TPA: hypothetical protein DDW41_03700 [Candidatus Andersenbacteria bacterium]|nr:hypothetical protein [Candidatus Andersenbacteria bacterium]
MKLFMLLFTTLLLGGCYYLGQNTYKDIVPNPSKNWSGPERLTVIMGAANHNLLDNRTNIKVIATPYYPSVVKAINRLGQRLYHWTEKEFQSATDGLVYESCGMYIDWQKENELVYDNELKRLESPLQFDSLMFFLTFQVRGWTSDVLRIQIPVPGGGGVVEQSIPLNESARGRPDITPIKEGSILLVNERGDVITPTMVWGKRMSYLTQNEESMYVKFHLRVADRYFLQESKRFFLTLRGYESNIRLEFSTDYMK